MFGYNRRSRTCGPGCIVNCTTILTLYLKAACQDLVGKGGAIANVGVHGAKVDLRLEELWGRGIRKSCPVCVNSANHRRNYHGISGH